MILYIHGFGGSAEGSTVQLLRKHMDLRVEGLNYDARDPKFAIEKIRMNQFGIQLYTTNDPIIDNSLAQKICKGFSSQTHFSEINEHRLSENIIMRIKEDVQVFYHTLCG